jgi:hypothetical protein
MDEVEAEKAHFALGDSAECVEASQISGEPFVLSPTCGARKVMLHRPFTASICASAKWLNISCLKIGLT